MDKTPEQMAEECDDHIERQAILCVSLLAMNDGEYFAAKKAYKAGYKAAQDHVAEASKKAIPDGPRFVSRNVPIFEPPEDNG